MGASGSLVFAGINEGGALKARDADKADPFKYMSKSAGGLEKAGARRVFVTPVGFVLDPKAG
jgi:CRISPR-associated endonuclease Csn1